MIVTHKINMDLTKRGTMPRIDAVQGDSNTRVVELTLVADGTPWAVPDGTGLRLRYSRPDGTRDSYDTMPDGTRAWSISGSTVTVNLVPRMLAVPGCVLAQVELSQGGSCIATFTFQVVVERDPGVRLVDSEQDESVALIPAPTQEYNGRFLRVVDGAASWETVEDPAERIGEPGELITKDKTSLVAAINEVYRSGESKVSTATQTLTDEQKTQARENISAADKSTVEALKNVLGVSAEESTRKSLPASFYGYNDNFLNKTSGNGFCTLVSDSSLTTWAGFGMKITVPDEFRSITMRFRADVDLMEHAFFSIYINGTMGLTQTGKTISTVGTHYVTYTLTYDYAVQKNLLGKEFSLFISSTKGFKFTVSELEAIVEGTANNEGSSVIDELLESVESIKNLLGITTDGEESGPGSITASFYGYNDNLLNKTSGDGFCTLVSDSSLATWAGFGMKITVPDEFRSITMRFRADIDLMEHAFFSIYINGAMGLTQTGNTISTVGTHYVTYTLTYDYAVQKNLLGKEFSLFITSTKGFKFTVSELEAIVDGTPETPTMNIVEKVEQLLSYTGKKILFMGDSITALGTGTRGWCGYFNQVMQPASFVNTAVNGAKWCDYADTVYDGNPVFNGPDGNVNNTMGNQVEKLLRGKDPTHENYSHVAAYEDFDIILIAAGTNDSTPAGEIEGSFIANGVPVALEELDKTVFASAFRYTIEKLQSVYPNAMIFICTPIQGVETTRSYESIKAKGDYLKLLADRMSVEIIDTFRCGICGVYEVSGGSGRDLADGLHPNASGAKKIGHYNAKKVIAGYMTI